LLGASALISTAALAACGAVPAVPAAEAPKAAEKPAAAAPAAPAKAAEQKVIRMDETFVQTDGRYQPYINTLKAAEKALGIKIDVVPGEYAKIWEKRKAAHAAGQADVDISINQVNWVGFGGVNGIFIDHTPLFQRDKIPLDRYYNADILAWSWQKKLFAIPMQSGGEVVLFNKQYFSEAGLQFPGKQWTYDDLLTMAQKLHKPSDKRWALQVGQNNLFYMGGTFMLNFGGSIMDAKDEKALYGEDPNSLRGAQFNVDLHLKHKFTPPSQVVQELLAGRSGIGILELGHIAMEFNGIFRYNASKKHMEANLDIAPAPKGVRQTSTLVGNAYSIMALSKAQETAWEFLKWLHSDKGVDESEYFGYIAWPPVIKHAAHPKWAKLFEGTQVTQVVDAWAKEGRPFPRVLEFDEAFPASNEPWQKALRGEITVAEGLRESAAKLNEIISRRPKEWRE